MVAGADPLLEYLEQEKDYITLHIMTAEFPGATHLYKIDKDGWGGTYLCDAPSIHYSIWLCNVTKFLFGEHPEDIYFEVA